MTSSLRLLLYNLTNSGRTASSYFRAVSASVSASAKSLFFLSILLSKKVQELENKVEQSKTQLDDAILAQSVKVLKVAVSGVEKAIDTVESVINKIAG